jgi:hypothetical protein
MDRVAFAASVLAFCLAALYFGFRGVAWLFAQLSGWHRLEQSFACEIEERLWTHHAETIRVGPIRFRRCVSAGVQPEALYLRAMAIFRFRALRIPWGRLSGFQPDHVYNRPAMRFTVGGSTIVVDMPLYAAMYPHVSRPSGA